MVFGVIFLKKALEKMFIYLKLIRIKHWVKNILIFIPLLFSGNLFVKDSFFATLIGFISFSLIASSIYIINDIKDIKKDREHEIKRNRPLASGKVGKKNAIILSIFLFLLGFSINSIYLTSNNFSLHILPIFYFVMNIMYSFGLKNKPIVDILILVLGFLIRIIYGALITNVVISNWLYLVVIFAAFYFGFGKRRNEFIKKGQGSRKVLRYYTKDFLDKNMYVCLTLSIVAYSLWCIDPITIERVGSNYLIWSIPIVIIIFQLYSLNIEGDSYGDPTDILLSDKLLLFTIGGYSIFMFLMLYLN
jgi:4-hydroxybenzoate polyprenyltransferase